MLDRAVIDALFPADLPEVAQWEERYPQRQLPENAKVTRFCPSPTGFLHIGSIYSAMLDRDIAHNSAGQYLVRVEDTDQDRQVEGAVALFDRAFDYFELPPDEWNKQGNYGPYTQSLRKQIYLSHVRELLRQDKAYLCFAAPDELTAISERQKAAKLPPGYYGSWAIWRDASADAVQAKLDAGIPYVVRFRSPGTQGARTRFVDAIRGELEMDDWFIDTVILKSSDRPLRLPTYHFAHAVDDHLMRVNLAIRGDEWLSSVPLHHQLFDALGFPHVTYAHYALILKQIPGGKRKLSKRKDPEASVSFYIESGYPAKAVLYYLRGLANSRLAELPLTEALTEPIRLAECSSAGALLDLVKLEDISADYIATLSSAQIFDEVHTWAEEFDQELATVLAANREFALRALDVERVNVQNPRKDLRKWSDFRTAYGFFFAGLFQPVPNLGDERFGGIDLTVAKNFLIDLVASYQPLSDPQEWFNQIRELAAKHGFAANAKEYKKNPEAYPGSIREASQMIRVTLTGSTRSPDLFEVATTLGVDEVQRRIATLLETT